MDWVKLSARYYLDPAVANFDDATEVMFTRALAYAGDQETHGFVPAGMLPALCRRRRYETSVEALVAAGLWRPVRGGYKITRWEEWQSELEAIVARRSADRDRKRRERQRQAGQRDHTQEFDGHVPADTFSQLNGMSRDMSAGLSAPIERREIEDTPPHASRASPPKNRGHRLPDTFPVTDDMVTWAKKHVPHIDPRYETAKFGDYWRAKSGRDACKTDWPATWRNWMRRAGEQTGSPRARHSRQAETDQLFDRAMARAEAREEANDPDRNGHPDPVRQSALPSAGH